MVKLALYVVDGQHQRIIANCDSQRSDGQHALVVAHKSAGITPKQPALAK